MSRVFHSHGHEFIDAPVDALVAALARRARAFFIFPFNLVLAMRPQREREAAKIAKEFHS